MRTGFERYVAPTAWDIGIGIFVVTLAAAVAAIEFFP
jgi:hypothetical protein